MKIQVEAERSGQHSFAGDLSPDELRLLGTSESKRGAVSVVLLTERPAFDAGHLTFDPTAAHVLNVGSSRSAVFIASPVRSIASKAAGPTGDALFQSQLPSDLRAVGVKLLDEVRKRWPGELRETQTSRKFVESPDNFWTVKIQPRAGTLALTVRGEPARFAKFSEFDVRRDQAGYSRFQIRKSEEVDNVIALLSEVARR